MDRKGFIEILKKCFGKQKDDRLHAIAMLIIYGIFVTIVIFAVRINSNNTDINLPSGDNKKEVISDNNKVVDDNLTSYEENIENDINYSYSYIVKFDDNTEVYLGKKIDDKEKFTFIKDGVSLDYAILNDNYLILDGGIYHLVDKLDTYFKYCDISKILDLVDNSIATKSGNIKKYYVSNYDLSSQFNDKIQSYNDGNNEIEIITDNNTLKKIDINFSNYISSVLGSNHNLIINMEFANIGTTENFSIKVN